MHRETGDLDDRVDASVPTDVTTVHVSTLNEVRENLKRACEKITQRQIFWKRFSVAVFMGALVASSGFFLTHLGSSLQRSLPVDLGERLDRSGFGDHIIPLVEDVQVDILVALSPNSPSSQNFVDRSLGALITYAGAKHFGLSAVLVGLDETSQYLSSVPLCLSVGIPARNRLEIAHNLRDTLEKENTRWTDDRVPEQVKTKLDEETIACVLEHADTIFEETQAFLRMFPVQSSPTIYVRPPNASWQTMTLAPYANSQTLFLELDTLFASHVQNKKNHR